MAHDHAPKQFLGVTISSTFTDLADHRADLRQVVREHGLVDIAMENDGAKTVDLIDSSLQMVRDGAAYIGVINGVGVRGSPKAGSPGYSSSS